MSIWLKYSSNDLTGPGEAAMEAERDRFAMLIALLRPTGLDPDAVRPADALWLAGHLGGSPWAVGMSAAPSAGWDPDVGGVGSPGGSRRRDSVPPAEDVGPESGALSLDVAATVPVPDAVTDPHAPGPHHALRPLWRHRTAGSRPRLILGEGAAAELSVVAGPFLPAHRGETVERPRRVQSDAVPAESATRPPAP
ncbi:hypothetical protein ACFW3D_38530 [Streptomyces sp. NPDC058864]